MPKFCGGCRYAGEFTMDNKKCKPCYFTTDDSGKRTKPNYRSKLKHKFSHTMNMKGNVGRRHKAIVI